MVAEAWAGALYVRSGLSSACSAAEVMEETVRRGKRGPGRAQRPPLRPLRPRREGWLDGWRWLSLPAPSQPGGRAET